MYLEELYTNAGEHKLQQCGDYHDVSYSPDGHKHTLDHMLQKAKVKGQRLSDIYDDKTAGQECMYYLFSELNIYIWRAFV